MIAQAQSRVRVLLCSHDRTVNLGKPVDLSPWVIQCTVQKRLKGDGFFTLTLVPAPAPPASAQVAGDGGRASAVVVESSLGSWLDVIRPNDVVNIYLNDGASGYVRQVLGYVDSIQRVSEVAGELGTVKTRYVVVGTDFTKALSLTNIYFNPWVSDSIAAALSGGAAGTAPLGDNLAGAELYREGLQWFGTPADIVESHLLVLLGYQAQWRLPLSYPDIPRERNGNIFTGGRDRRADEEHLDLILRGRQVAVANRPLVQRVPQTDKRVSLAPPPELEALAGQLEHPLRNGAPLLGTDTGTGRTAATPQFLADRGSVIHFGVDIAIDTDPAARALVYPVGPGTLEQIVFRRDEDEQWTADTPAARAGNLIKIRHEVTDDTGALVATLYSVYMHLDDWYVQGHNVEDPTHSKYPDDVKVLNPKDPSFSAGRAWRVGDAVTPDQPIAFADRTGRFDSRTPAHLHFELRYRDPAVGEVWLDPQRLIPAIGGRATSATVRVGAGVNLRPEERAKQLLDSVRKFRTDPRFRRAMRTLLDVLDRSYIERDHIDGFIASEQSLFESGSVLTLMDSNANESMNELFCDLRLAGRRERADDPVTPQALDELGGNGPDENGVVAPCYLPAVVLREYPFTTISKGTYPIPDAPPRPPAGEISAGGDEDAGDVLDTLAGAAPEITPPDVPKQAGEPDPVTNLYGLPEQPGVFFSSRRHPVRAHHVRPILTDTPKLPDQPAFKPEDEAARKASGDAQQADADAAAAESAALKAEQGAVAAEQQAANEDAIARADEATADAAVREYRRSDMTAGPDLPPELQQLVDRAAESRRIADASRAAAIGLRARADDLAAAARDARSRADAAQADAARSAEVAAGADEEVLLAHRRQASSWRYIDTATLTLDRVLRMEIGRSDYDYFNLFDLQAADSTIQAPLPRFVQGITPVLSYESFTRHGIRVREIRTKATQLGGPAIGRGLQEILARWAVLNDHWHQHANQYLAGTIHCLPLLDCRVGYRLDLPELDECYYVEGVQHDWQIDEGGKTTLRTTLTVTRGQPLVRRPNETIRHNSIPGSRAGEATSRDSDGIGAAVGSEVILPGGRTALEVAREVSAAKPPPPVVVTRTDVFLRSAIGTRYFPVVDLAAGYRLARGLVVGGHAAASRGRTRR